MPLISKKYSEAKSPLMIIIAVVIIAAIIGLLYWFSIKNAKIVTPTPTGTPVASISPTTTPKATPTQKPTPTPIAKKSNITVGSTATLDGFESSNGGGNLTADIRAGRNIYLNTRGFVAFKIPSELTGKQVDSAKMRLYQAQVIGSPYASLGKLMADHLDFGTSLENSDYSITAIQSGFAMVTNNAAIEYKDVDVKDQLINDLANGRTYSEYRIHFEDENLGGNSTGDFAYFESQDDSMGTGNQPQLVITYH